MYHCYRHDIDHSSSDCPRCLAEQRHEELVDVTREGQEEAARLASEQHEENLRAIEESDYRRANPGDYQCPHCGYITLRLDFDRCPLCRGSVREKDPEYWTRVHAELERRAKAAAEAAAERQKQKAAAEAKQRAEAQARAEAAAAQAAFDAKANLSLVLFLIVAAIGLAIWISQRQVVHPTGSVVTSKTVNSDASKPSAGEPRWKVGVLPIARGLGDSKPMISRLDLIDSRGQAVPYQVQYVPTEFLKYIADHLRARGPVTLSGAPDGLAGSDAKVAVAIGETVRILEAFSDVKSPLAFRVDRGVEMIQPFSVSPTTPNGRPYAVAPGTVLVAVHHTLGECPTFLVSTSGFQDLCWPQSTDVLKSAGDRGRVRTALLVQLESGRSAWTSFVDEDGAPDKWFMRDWIACETVYRGTEQQMTCKE